MSDSGDPVGLDVGVGGRDVRVDPGCRRVDRVDGHGRGGQARVIAPVERQVGLDVGRDRLLGELAVGAVVGERGRGRVVGRRRRRRPALEVLRVRRGDRVTVGVELELAGLGVDDRGGELLADDLGADELAAA